MKNKIVTVILWIFTFLFAVLSTIIEHVSDWFDYRFGVSFEAILFTITSPLEGSDASFMNEAVEWIKPYFIDMLKCLVVVAIIAVVLWVIVINIEITIKNKIIKIDIYKVYQSVCLIFASVLFLNSVKYGFKILDLKTYVTRKMDSTSIYEEYYVKPAEVAITNDGTKNLIYIYLESMETTYASKEVGGSQEINYIPYLTDMAQKNVSFSHTNQLGGAHVTAGSGWTMAALLSTTSGVPFSLPVEGNSMDTFERFLPGVTSLGDVLEQNGYEQVFLCGSDGSFGGRELYFTQHGNYEIVDYFDAVQNGYIESGYWVWWGYEDEKLYEIAKDELTELAKSDKPFNFTMLTVDTHHIDGYVCGTCGNEYEEQLANVVSCADRQVMEFVEWCKEQEFFEDSVIVITGDHFRMDSSLIYDTSDRKLYNCFINSSKEPQQSTENRIFTSLDLFPTTLSAMGFQIEGDKLGLGTDLFSNEKTLAETIGYEVLNEELGKYSKYYVENFE